MTNLIKELSDVDSRCGSVKIKKYKFIMDVLFKESFMVLLNEIKRKETGKITTEHQRRKNIILLKIYVR